MSMPLLVVALSVAVECQVAPWRADPAQAISDSADVIVEGIVSGVRLLSRAEVDSASYLRTPYEVTFVVDRSWRARVGRVITARVEDIECDPNPQFLNHEILGLMATDDGWWIFTSVTPSSGAMPRDEVSALLAGLGPSLEPSAGHPLSTHLPMEVLVGLLGVALGIGVGLRITRLRGRAS